MNVVCPKCLSESAVSVDVADGESLHCPECSEDYNLSEVIDVIESWSRVLPWLKSHPARQQAPQCVAAGK